MLLISLLFAAATAALLLRYVQCRIWSPLKDIPGPLIASLTGYWLICVDIAGKRTATIHRLHRKYGSAIRIGPNEVSFSNPSGYSQIYTQQTKFMKAPAYEFMSVKPLGIFSLRDKTAHSQRRSLLSHAFSQQSIENCLPVIREKIDLLLDTVERNKGKPLDMLLRFRLLALDIVGELFLGQSFGGLEADKAPQFLHDGDLHFLQSGLQGNLPWLHSSLKLLPVPQVHDLLGSSERIAQFGNQAFQRYIQKHGYQSNRKDLLTKILTSEEKGTKMTDRETYVEIANLVFAGTDTTSTTLTYLFWELARNPEWQVKVRDELRRVDDLTNATFTSPMPVLEAVIDEALRLHPAAPASLLRIVPTGGAELDGFWVPAGTIVSAQCYTTHRDETAFPRPEVFDPSRWLSGDASENVKALFMPFSRGTRACLGKNLAMFELKSTTAALLSRYKVTAPAQTNEDSMTMVDHFLTVPKAGRCDLTFTPI